MVQLNYLWELRRIENDGTLSTTPTVLRCDETTTLGRGKNNTLQCLSILSSREHCCIHVNSTGDIFIKDLKSLNGTYLGEQRILPAREIALKDGDLIGIGVQTSDISDDSNYIFKLSKIIQVDSPAISLDEPHITDYPDSSAPPINGAFIKDGITHFPQPFVSIPSTSKGITNNDLKQLKTRKNEGQLNVVTIIDSEEEDVEEVNVCSSNNNEVLGCETVNSNDIQTTNSSKVITYKDDRSKSENNINRNEVLSVQSRVENATISCDNALEHNNIDSPVILNSVKTRNEINKTEELEKDKNKQTGENSIEKSVDHCLISTTKNPLDITDLQNDVCIPLAVENINLSLSIENKGFEPNTSKKNTDNDKNTTNNLESNQKLAGSVSSEIIESQLSSNININVSEIVTEQNLKMSDNLNQNKEKNKDLFDSELSVVPKGTYLHSENGKSNYKNKECNVISDIDLVCNVGNSNQTVSILTSGIELVSDCVESVQKTGKNEIKNDSVDKVNSPEKEALNVGILCDSHKNEEGKKLSVGKTNKKSSEVDEMIKNIYKRRISHQVENISNLNNIIESITTKQHLEENITPHVSSSFTIDDTEDIILIEDDDDLPCSQMFDVKEEPVPEENNQLTLDYIVDLEEDDNSEADSTDDEWFQRLSQSVDNEDGSTSSDSDCELNNLKSHGDLENNRDNAFSISQNSDRTSTNLSIESKLSSFAENKNEFIENSGISSNEKLGDICPARREETTLEQSRNIEIESNRDKSKPTTSKVSFQCRKKSIEPLKKDEITENIDNNLGVNDDEIDSSDNEPSELIIVRKIPLGCRNKLPDSSDEEGDENEVVNKRSKNKNKVFEFDEDLNEPVLRKLALGSKRKHEETSDEDDKSEEIIFNDKDENDLDSLKKVQLINADITGLDEKCEENRSKKKYLTHINKKHLSNKSTNKSQGNKLVKRKVDTSASHINKMLKENIDENKVKHITIEKVSEGNKIGGIESSKKFKTLGKRKSSLESNGSDNCSSKSTKKIKKVGSDNNCIITGNSDGIELIRHSLKSVSDDSSEELSSDDSGLWLRAKDTVLTNVKNLYKENMPIESTSSINKISSKGHEMQDFQSRQTKDLYFDDIEEQIKPNTISKSSHLALGLNNKSSFQQITPEIKTSVKSLQNESDKEHDTETPKIPDNHFLKSENAKLSAVSKKINASHKKRAIPIIDAKSLPVRRKQVVSTDSNVTSKDSPKDEKTHETWISKKKSEVVPTKLPESMSKADRKAIVKQKLKDINKSKEDCKVNVVEKPKVLNTAKNTTKNTNKSRNEIFLDTLVSTDNMPKDNNLPSKNDKEINKDKINLSSYKIPRRPSNAEEQTYTVTTKKTGVGDTKISGDNSLKPGNSAKNPIPTKLVKAESKSVQHIGKLNTTSTKCSNAVNSVSLVDQILTKADGNKLCTRSPQMSTKISGGLENEEPIKVNHIFDDGTIHQPLNLTHFKPILKSPGGRCQKNKENTKNVKFCHPGENNVVYRMTREIEIADNAMLKPITKNVARKDPPPPRKKPNDIHNTTYTNSWEETIFQICKWNTVWFEEKNTCKGEPGVFQGQVYHLKDDFTGYNDYRRGMFPLLLYELWQTLAKQHDDIKDRINPFNIEIRKVTPLPVRNQFVPLQNANEKRVLNRLECQTLLDRQKQKLWPRAGDLVVLHVQMKDKNTPQRILAYLFSSNFKPISAHKDVTHRLKQKYPNASQVMDFTLYIKEMRYPIDDKQETRMAVLKNIKPELRLFTALDRLSSSSLLKIICHPKENVVALPSIDFNKAAYSQNAHLNPAQKKAAVTVARACSNENNIVHLIHGPPGCGKSEVIIGIIMQMWVAKQTKATQEKPKILLCAPSNAAIDDIFNKLMNIRQSITKMPKMNMVRIGRTDMAHKNVSSMTLDFLVDKDLKKERNLMEDEQLKAVELRTLEAKKNQMTYQLDNPGNRANDINYMSTLQRKLGETLQRIKELENGKTLRPSEQREKRKETEEHILEGAHVIATTLSSCYNAQMEQAYLNKKLKFTCCIVDEATQCTEPETLIPLMLGINNLVLVGDPQQLPATVLSQTAKEHGFVRSLFARQYLWWQRNCQDPNIIPLFNTRCHFLNVQYRMHPAIAQWPSEYFYKNAVISHESLKERTHCPLLPYIVLSHNYEQSPQEESNLGERRMVTRLVHCIAKCQKLRSLSIGIITPYNCQRDHYRESIRPDLTLASDVEVGSVDSFQGREKDVIIFSCVRTDGVGFMGDTERLNVALTRAKYSLIICGNFKSLEVQRDTTWFSLLNNAKSRGVYKSLENVDPNTDLLAEILKPNQSGVIV